MIIKNSTVVLFSTSHVHSIFATTAPCGSIPLERIPRPEPISKPKGRNSRGYATISGAQAASLGKNDPSPPQWPTCDNPTPYDIFNIETGAPYTKARYYQLVKLYHPDKHHHVAIHGVSYAARLERYRLVVRANDILCDPQKRRAYDLYGAGWVTGSHRSVNDIYRTANRKWREEPGNAANNATWEDWEQWYAEQRDGKKPEPLYMSHQAFAALLLVLVAIGGSIQAARAESHTAHVVRKRQERHAAITEEITRKGIATAGMSSPERIENFVRERENSAYKFAPNRFDSVEESPDK